MAHRARTLIAITLVAVCLPLAAAQGQGPTLRAGSCVADITPVSPGLAAAYEAAFGVPAVVNHTDPVFIAGFGDNRAATGYNDRLWARGGRARRPGRSRRDRVARRRGLPER